MPLLEVKMEKEGKSVSANKAQQVTCRAVGSSPQPRISWWKAGARLQATHETVCKLLLKRSRCLYKRAESHCEYSNLGTTFLRIFKGLEKISG